MNTFLRVLSLSIGLLAGLTVDTFAAELTVSIAELRRDAFGKLQERVHVDAAAPGKFKLSKATSPATTTTPTVVTSLVLLDCPDKHPTLPCMVFFPSATRGGLPTDTFAFSDACGVADPVLPDCDDTTIAQVIQTDSTTDNLEVSGLHIRALTKKTEAWVSMVASTGEKGMNGGTSAGSFAFSAMLDGTFTTVPPTGPPNDALVPGCVAPSKVGDNTYVPPCARWLLEVNNIPADPGVPLDIQTISVPCKGGTNPCGFGGGYDSEGKFNTVKSGSVSCGSACAWPTYTGTLSVKFIDAEQTFALYNSAVAVRSNRTEEEFGHEDVSYVVAKEYKKPFWVSFTAASEIYRAIPKVQKSADEVQLEFQLQRSKFVPASHGVSLTSIGSGDDPLPLSERIRNDRSYASFIASPKSLPWKGVDVLRLDYEVVTKPSPPGDARLKSLPFSDCANGSFYVRVALTGDDGQDAGNLNISLGSSQQFTSGCAVNKLSGTNLMSNADPRVAFSPVAGKPVCCMTIQQSRNSHGNLFVRSISVVVDQGSLKAPANYKVNLFEATVNGISATKFLTAVDPEGYKNVDGLPEKGRSILISKQGDSPDPKPVVLGDEQITNSGNVFSAKVPFTGLKGKGDYTVDFCLAGGRCVPMQVTFPM